MKLAIIGAGNLGLAIANGVYENGLVYQLYLTKRNIKSLETWKSKQGVKLTSDNQEAIANSEVVIFAIQPGQFEAILEEVKPVLTKNQLLISVITGYKIEKIESILGKDYTIVRAMPNTAIAVGESMTCISVNEKAKSSLEQVEAIFQPVGKTLVIPEEQMQAATVICASGIAFWMRLIRATTQGAIQLGFEADEAQELAMQTCYGAASLLLKTGNHPEQEIDNVTTPKGCTIEGLNEMEHQGLSSSLIKGIVTSYEKINKIKPL